MEIGTVIISIPSPTVEVVRLVRPTGGGAGRRRAEIVLFAGHHHVTAVVLTTSTCRTTSPILIRLATSQ